MRLQSVLATAFFILSPVLPQQAQATNTVEIVWISTTGAGTPGSSSIDAVEGDRLVGEVRISPDAGGLLSYAVSVEFDADLADELDLVSATEFLPGAMEANFSPGTVDATVESSGAQAGFIFTMEAVTLSFPGPTSGTVVAAELTFDVTANVATDGDDLTPGSFTIGDNGIGNNAYALVTPGFVGAAVNLGQPFAAPALSVVAVLIALVALGVLIRGRLITHA